MRVDHYKILEIHSDSTKEQIKKQYHNLCKIYHPDKNNGEDIHFKRIKEAYEVLYDDKSRKLYDIQYIFGDFTITEDEYDIFIKYYHSFINSNEFILMKKIYKTIPENVKKDIKQKFTQKIYKNRTYHIVKKEKSIDITKLDTDETVILYVSYDDYLNKKLKIIHIHTKNGYYYLYLRDFKNKSMIFDNIDCILTLKIYVKDNYL